MAEIKLSLETRRTPDGRTVLYFPFMCVSDIHWGTKYSRGRRVCSLFEHTECATLALAGDIVDLLAMRNRRRWSFDHYHRFGIAQVLRKAAKGTAVHVLDGNHEEGARGEPAALPAAPASGEDRPHRNLAGKSLLGLRFHHEFSYAAPGGESYLILHGDQYDGKISDLYWIGDLAYTLAYEVDSVLRHFGVREKSFAAWCKKGIKTIINEHLGVHKVMAEALDRSPYRGFIYGHSHMAGFETSPGGKLMINDGCCTEHVQALVHDRHGRWAIVTWHKNRLHILEPEGNKADVLFRDLGMGKTLDAPKLREGKYTALADRLLRLIYRAAPPGERPRLREEARAQRLLVDKFRAIARFSPMAREQNLLHDIRLRHRAEQVLEERLSRLDPLPNPGRDRRKGETRRRKRKAA